jgi:hypothetical protein
MPLPRQPLRFPALHTCLLAGGAAGVLLLRLAVRHRPRAPRTTPKASGAKAASGGRCASAKRGAPKGGQRGAKGWSAGCRAKRRGAGGAKARRRRAEGGAAPKGSRAKGCKDVEKRTRSQSVTSFVREAGVKQSDASLTV